MLTTYYYVDLYNKQQLNLPESEYDYFMRKAREMKEARVMAMRQARKAKIKAAFAQALETEK